MVVRRGLISAVVALVSLAGGLTACGEKRPVRFDSTAWRRPVGYCAPSARQRMARAAASVAKIGRGKSRSQAVARRSGNHIGRRLVLHGRREPRRASHGMRVPSRAVRWEPPDGKYRDRLVGPRAERKSVARAGSGRARRSSECRRVDGRRRSRPSPSPEWIRVAGPHQATPSRSSRRGARSARTRRRVRYLL